MGKFTEVNLEQIPCAENANADALDKLGSHRVATLLGVIPLEIQKQPSIFQAMVMGVDVQKEESWVTPILDYITKGTLPADKDEARRIKYKEGRFWVPYKLILDNGKQFDSKEMRKLFDDLKIQKGFSAAKLEEKKGYWPEELPMVLWSYNTTPGTTTGKSPFTLTYRCEAMVPMEICSGSFRRDNYNPMDNEVNHRLYLDLVEEVRATS
ncbi:uncharacterized protein LOC141695968 [Apium graveolens]|uniref:uncharacterized protein LOC141695968 n=1 Tax=Apium graveolens TaxID=4045 RepID=UPI003D7B08D7